MFASVPCLLLVGLAAIAQDTAPQGAAESLDALQGLDARSLLDTLDELDERPDVATLALQRLVAGDAPEVLRPALAQLVSSGLSSAAVLDAVPLLADRDPAVRRAAIALFSRPDLGRSLRPERSRALARVAREDSDPAVVRDAVAALGRIGGEPAVEVLRSLALDGPRSVRRAAADALADSPDGLRPLLEIVRTSGRSGAEVPTEVLAALLPRYGQWLADAPSPRPVDYAPLVFGLDHPARNVRRASGDAFDRLVGRLVDSAIPGRATKVLGELEELGIDRDVALYQRARIALSAEGDAEDALAAANSLVASRGVLLRPSARIDAFESQLWTFRGLYLRGVSETALGRFDDAEQSLAAAAEALDLALAERRDLLADSERLRHVDLLHQRAVVEVARTLAAIARDAPVAEIVERARAAHVVHLEAQAVFAEVAGDVTTGWDALLASDLSPYRLLFGRRGFAPSDQPAEGAALDRATIVRLEGRLGAALCAVAPGELPGFVSIVEGAPGAAAREATDPLADPRRRALLERIRDARITGADEAIREARDALVRAQGRAPSLLPEAEIRVLERLQRRRMAAQRALTDPSGDGTSWARDLRIPGSAGIWYAQDLTEEGRGAEARAVASRVKTDVESRGISNWWFFLGHERVARAQMLLGSAYTDDGLGAEAEEALLEAVERIEDIVSQLREQGATEADLGGFQDLHASALVSLAVNANVRLLDPEKARRYYERAYDIRKDEFMRALLACYRARSGAEAEARALLRTIRPGPGTWYNLACTHALLGDVDEALDYLRTDIELNHASEESRDRQREWAAEDPDLEALRDDPRFRRLVRTD